MVGFDVGPDPGERPMSPADGSRAIDPRIKERRESVERSRTQRRLRWAAAVLGVAALVALGRRACSTPRGSGPRS